MSWIIVFMTSCEFSTSMMRWTVPVAKQAFLITVIFAFAGKCLSWLPKCSQLYITELGYIVALLITYPLVKRQWFVSSTAGQWCAKASPEGATLANAAAAPESSGDHCNENVAVLQSQSFFAPTSPTLAAVASIPRQVTHEGADSESEEDLVASASFTDNSDDESLIGGASTASTEDCSDTEPCRWSERWNEKRQCRNWGKAGSELAQVFCNFVDDEVG